MSLRTLEYKISPRKFNLLATMIAAVWLLGIYPALNWFYPNQVPRNLSGHARKGPTDFEQYYAGAIAAKNHLWDHLYPVIRTETYNSPSLFKPRWDTFLFDKSTANKNIYYYPHITTEEASDYSPELLALCPQLEHSERFMYPPPLALLLYPLAFFDFDTCAHKVWPTLAIFSLFGVAFFSSRIHRVLHGHVSYAEGLIFLLMVLYSYRAGMSVVAVGNVTPILACCIAFSAYSWVLGRQARLGAAMIPLLLFKGMGVTWCPLFLLKPVQWRTLFSLAGLTIVLNVLMLFLAGSKIYSTYFYDILPKTTIPVGQGIVPTLLYSFGIYPKGLYSLISLALLLPLYFGYYKNASSPHPHGPAVAIAAIAGTLAIFCLLNFSVWDIYFPMHVYFPFLGWFLWERSLQIGIWRLGFTIGIAAGFAVLYSWPTEGVAFHLFGERGVVWYRNWVVAPNLFFILPILTLIACYRRLFWSSEAHRQSISVEDAGMEKTLLSQG